MTSGDSTRISAAAGMQLNNHRIGKRVTTHPVSRLSDTIEDTLETGDGESSGRAAMNVDEDAIADETVENDSVLPGDVLDISG